MLFSITLMVAVPVPQEFKTLQESGPGGLVLCAVTNRCCVPFPRSLRRCCLARAAPDLRFVPFPRSSRRCWLARAAYGSVWSRQ